MPIPLTIVDAFTDHPFSGNPAAVCVLDRPLPDRRMQQIAAEMNLSETAFLLPEGDAFRLRWFTPLVEVELCGHATLASAHALWESGRLPADAVARFQTRSGLLTAKGSANGIALDFPSVPPQTVEPPAGLIEALGVTPQNVERGRFDYLVEIGSESMLRAMSPDLRRLREAETRGVIVTCRSETPGYDFLSRFFAPAAGIDEDPVTGSAHCCLAPYWAARLGRIELTGYQASARGGVVRVRLAGDRVKLIGQAVTVLRGELRLPHDDAEIVRERS